MSEAQTYIERLRELRENSLKTLDGLDTKGLNWKPTRTETNSLFVLATHLIGSERAWIHKVVGQRSVERDRDAEFRARGSSVDALRAAFAELARTSEAVLTRLLPADFDATRVSNSDSQFRSVRWCVIHVVEHYSEHLGQMTLTRQLWQAQAKSANAKSRMAKSKKGGSAKAKKRQAKR